MPSLKSRGFVIFPCWDALVGLSLRGLERVHLPVLFFGNCLQMGSHVAGPRTPLGGRIRECHAVFAGGIVHDLLAALACLNNDMAGAAIETAAFLGHEETVLTFLYA